MGRYFELRIRIPEEVFQEMKLPKANRGRELKKSFAVWLYAKGILGAGKARELAGVDLIDFYALLEKADVYLNYDKEMVEEDLRSLKGLGI